MKDVGFAGRLAGTFIRSKLTPLIIAASVLLGIGAGVLPRIADVNRAFTAAAVPLLVTVKVTMILFEASRLN